MKHKTISKYVPILISLSFAFVFIGSILFILGENPLRIYWLFIAGVIGTWQNFGNTLFQSTPLIFSGLSVALAFRAGLFNIGAEGQLYWGAFAAFWVAWKTGLLLPGTVSIMLAIIGAFIAGGAWGAIPGYLKSKFGVHEVIVTIMLNFIALASVNYLVTIPYHAPGDQIPQTDMIPSSTRLSYLGTWFQEIGFHGLEEAPVNTSFFLALIVSYCMTIFLWKTKWGFEIRAVGLNPYASLASGISAGRVMVGAMAMSGGIAGLVGVNEVLGYRYQLIDGFSPGFGNTGIAVALLGRNHPLGIVIAALFFGAIAQGGLIVDIYSNIISKDIVYVMQGIIMLCVISEGMVRFGRRSSVHGSY